MSKSEIVDVTVIVITSSTMCVEHSFLAYIQTDIGSQDEVPIRLIPGGTITAPRPSSASRFV
jgi:hypothetical protein